MSECCRTAENIDELEDVVQRIIEKGEDNPDINGNDLLREFKYEAENTIMSCLPIEFCKLLEIVYSLHDDLPNIDFPRETALYMLNHFIKYGTIYGDSGNKESN